MAYDRDNLERNRGHDQDRGRDHGRGREPGGRYGDGDGDGGGRGFFERAGDEISSWFGDEDAERRRETDQRERSQGDGRERFEGRAPDRERGWFGGASTSDDDRFVRPDAGRSVSGDRQQRERSDRSNDSARQSYGRDDFDRSRSEEYRPFAGDYGRGFAERAGHDEPRDRGRQRPVGAASASSGQQFGDPHYQEWRQRQIEELDRDYDEYRREHQSKFDNDFTGWRTQRKSHRSTVDQVREHMDVVGSDDETVGRVDKVRGDRIVLTKDSDGSGGVHRSLACSEIERVDGDRVVLKRSAEDAKTSLRAEPGFVEQNSRDLREPAERDRSGQSDGPHILDRSFSGTYR